MDKFMKSRTFVTLVYVLLGLVILFLLQQIKPILSTAFGFLKAVLAPFVIALIISYVLNPIVRLLNERKVPRTAAVLLIYAVFITSVVVVVMNLTPMFVKQLGELNEHMPELTVRAQGLFDGLNENRLVPESVRNGINNALLKAEDALSTFISNLVNGIGSTINTLMVAFIVPFLAFYILKDYQLIEKTVLATVPRTHRKNAIKLVIDIDTALGNYIRGQFLVCLLVGLFAYLGYWLIGMPYALLLASIVAVFNIIPYLGPFFGAAPAIIMASTVSLKMVLFVVLVNFIVQILEGNVISPQVVGRTLHLHPLLIIFALLVGGKLAGIIGLILAVPVFAVLKVIVQHIFIYYVQRKPTT
ncbi:MULTISPECIES: AI-2E family transporter [Paenibacillus]|uniref:AI-2E family transporter n=1 Tax=Paenibacillus oceani TaxID=2772510 RepID=A0A927CGE8_9BACL|nr:AI-2E family transporter [Paenibacillus oceani]MBD2865285.1 AI-2E family transporter [Paenibacillus oceani]MDF2659154.1 permease [Paenibacillus sp.]